MPLMKEVIRARRRAEQEKPPEPEEESVEDQSQLEASFVEGQSSTSSPVLSPLRGADVSPTPFSLTLTRFALEEEETLPDSSLPLHRAAEMGDIETLKDLLAKVGGRENIDQHDPDCNHMTTLMVAADKEQTSIIAELLRQRADINAVQRPAHYEKQTCHVAANKGEVFKLDAGRTALMFAATIGSVKVVTQLLDMTANVNRVSGGKTALDWALLCEKTAVVELLQEAGGMTREDVNVRTFFMAAGVDLGENESETVDGDADATAVASQKFEEWDADESGFIDATELEGIMVKLQVQFTRKDIRNLMLKMGATRNKLSRKNFLKFCGSFAQSQAEMREASKQSSKASKESTKRRST